MSSDQKKQDPLGALRRKLSVQKVNVAKVKALVKLKTIAKISIMGRRGSTAKDIKANRDKYMGRPGLFRSCRPVHAFDSDATIEVTRAWGTSSAEPGDFIVVGEPKSTTNWRNDVYT